MKDKYTLNAFTVDVEDWFQGIELNLSEWRSRENRIDVGLFRILDILDEYQIKATFFTLGAVAKSNPKSVKRISNLGHEIASHTMFHEKIYDLNPDTFFKQESECKKILEDLAETSINGFRAPYFSITRKSLWALEVLQELGYKYDSSISPIETWRYGISDVLPGIYEIAPGFIEYTPSAGSFFKHHYGIGGAYFRLYPYYLTKKSISEHEMLQTSNMFYIHPWELDPHHPRVKLPLKPFVTHYSRLKSTQPKLHKLLSDFDFKTVSEVIELEKKRRELPQLTLGENIET